jgi:hypothetical protein
MNVSVRSLPLLFILLVVAGLISAPSLQAQSVATAPVGYIQNTLPPSTDGTNRNFSVVSFPLHQPAPLTLSPSAAPFPLLQLARVPVRT